MQRHFRQTLAAIAFASITAAGCSQPAAPTGAPPTTVFTPVAVAPSPSPAVTHAPAATPEFPAPQELIGRWRTELQPGDIATLELTQTGYIITRFNIGTGRIEVEGNEIRFSHSALCDGEGRYQWSIAGETLHFDPVGSDPCPGRVEVLKNVTYKKV